MIKSNVLKIKIFNCWTGACVHYPFERPVDQKSIADNAFFERPARAARSNG